MSRTGFEAHWLCENDHSYIKSIHARGARVGCPICMEQGFRYKKTAITEDRREFQFEHKDGSTFDGTIFEFSKKHSLDRNRVKEFVIGRVTSHLGWFLKGKDPRKPVKIVSLTHPTFGDYEGSIREFCEKYDLKRGSVDSFLNPKNSKPSHKGWKLKL